MCRWRRVPSLEGHEQEKIHDPRRSRTPSLLLRSRRSPPPCEVDGLDGSRLEALIVGRLKWLNGTVLHYYFFDRETDGSRHVAGDGTPTFMSWVGAEEQRAVVRESFRAWHDLGMGLEFAVDNRAEAEVRIGFMRGDGSWSYVGRDIARASVPTPAPINYGWPL